MQAKSNVRFVYGMAVLSLSLKNMIHAMYESADICPYSLCNYSQNPTKVCIHRLLLMCLGDILLDYLFHRFPVRCEWLMQCTHAITDSLP